MKSPIRFALLAVTAFAAAAPAVAGPVLKTYNFSATFFGAPIDSATGSFTLSFDDSASFNGTTAGFTLNSLSLPYDGILNFAYDASSDELVIGDETLRGIGPFASSTDDENGTHFTMFIENVSGTPSGNVQFTVLNGGTDYVARQTDLAVSDGAPSPAPEPASWALMLGGFGLVGGVMRSRKRSVSFA